MNEHHRIVGKPFPKGQSGNPGGRPAALRDVTELARSYAPDAIKTLAAVMLDEETPPAARVGAASAILDRGFGKAPQAVQMSGPDGGPIETHEYTNADRVAGADLLRTIKEGS